MVPKSSMAFQIRSGFWRKTTRISAFRFDMSCFSGCSEKNTISPERTLSAKYGMVVKGRLTVSHFMKYGKGDPEINQCAYKRLPHDNPPSHQENHTGRKQKKGNHVKGDPVGVHTKSKENHGQIQLSASPGKQAFARESGFILGPPCGSLCQKIQAQ